MLGDAQDMAGRLRAVLPSGWFADSAPIVDAVLQGIGAGWAALYGLIQAVRSQTRILTAVGQFLDLISVDFFGNGLPRRLQEPDAAYLVRIENELLRPRGTRAALALALTQLTGFVPTIFEPARSTDTGGWASGGLGYGTPNGVAGGGGWGNLHLPFQFFVTAYRPHGGGIANVAGYDTGGYLFYGGSAMIATPVTDADIYAEAAAVVPASTVAWTRIAPHA